MKNIFRKLVVLSVLFVGGSLYAEESNVKVIGTVEYVDELIAFSVNDQNCKIRNKISTTVCYGECQISLEGIDSVELSDVQISSPVNSKISSIRYDGIIGSKRYGTLLFYEKVPPRHCGGSDEFIAFLRSYLKSNSISLTAVRKRRIIKQID